MIEDKKAVIFDLDGVITDTEPLNDDHHYKFLAEIGVNPATIVPFDRKGLNTPALWSALIEKYNLNYTLPELVKRARQSYLNYLRALPEIPIIEGAVELIHKLKEDNYVLAVASSANPQRVDLLLSRIGLEKYFSVIVNGDDVENSKPAPDAFLIAADRLHILASACTVIEDSHNGVLAAKAAGMKCIALVTDKSVEREFAIADLVVNSLQEINVVTVDAL